MLNELDKELARRGHPFVRYANDSMVFCKSKRAAERVRESITKFIEGEQREDHSFIHQGSEISRLLLLCTQRQMPTHRTSEVQSKDEVKIKRVDKSKQRMRVWEEETEA